MIIYYQNDSGADDFNDQDYPSSDLVLYLSKSKLIRMNAHCNVTPLLVTSSLEILM